MGEVIRFIPKSKDIPLVYAGFGPGKLIRFVPKSERERARLVREARLMYDCIFPPADPVTAQRDAARQSHMASDANANRSDGIILS
jgi:hypothetical protein